MASICFKHPLRMNGMHRMRIKLRNMKYKTNRDLQHFTSFHCPARHVVSSTLPRAFHRKGLKKPWQLKQVSSSRRGEGGGRWYSKRFCTSKSQYQNIFLTVLFQGNEVHLSAQFWVFLQAEMTDFHTLSTHVLQPVKSLLFDKPET